MDPISLILGTQFSLILVT